MKTWMTKEDALEMMATTEIRSKIEENVQTREEVVRNCQKYLRHIRSDLMIGNDTEDSKKLLKYYLNNFVNEARPNVEGMTLDEVKVYLEDEIMEYSVITSLIQDKNLSEIQINAYNTLFIEKNGSKNRAYDIYFNSPEKMMQIANKILENSGVKISVDEPIGDARLPDGSRVAVTHKSIFPKIPGVEQTPTMVIRKFPENRMTYLDLLENKTFSAGMLELLVLFARARVSWVTSGGTGTGKTTVNEFILRQVDDGDRMIAIENPTEMKLIKFDDSGRIKNNVIQFEAKNIDNPKSKSPTVSNLLIHALRMTPDWIVLGEARRSEEFKELIKAGQTGHHVCCTMHSNEKYDAIYRILSAYLEGTRESEELALKNICSVINFVIHIAKLPDNSRKIMSISEIIGVVIIIEVISGRALQGAIVDVFKLIRHKVVQKNIISTEQMKKEYRAFRDVKGYRSHLFDFFQDIISDLEYKDVTPQGLWLGMLLLTSLGAVGIYMYTHSVLMGILSYPIILVQVMAILYLLSRLSHEQRVIAIMDSLDLICPLIETNGVTRSIEISIEYMDPMVQKYFEEFILHVKEQNYYFGEAMNLLCKDLGHVFLDFAKKAIIYNENPVEGSADIFLDVIDSNADMRMVLELKRREFEKINFEYVGSFLVIMFFVIIMMYINVDFKDFYLSSYIGRTLLIGSLSVVSIIFSILQYLQSRLDVRDRIVSDKEYLE